MAQKFTITAELNLQTKNLNQVVNNLRQQFHGANLNIKIKDLAKAEASMRNLGKHAKVADKSLHGLANSIGAAAKRFSAIALATGTFVGLTRAVKNAVGSAVEFEREMVKISQATGQTVDQLGGLKKEIGDVASGFGVASDELIKAARDLTQAGFAADKVRGALKLLAQTELAATFDSIQDTTEGVIAVLNQFGREAQKTGNEVEFLEKSLSAINQVSKAYAVESADLITAIRTTGSAFETAGGSLDELIALFTSVRSTTRESAESISTGFRTIFTRMQRLDTINSLKKLGIDLQDVEGKFVGPMEAVKRLSIALSSLDPKDFRFNLIVEELGGFRQVSKVIPLIQQFTVAQKALGVAQNSSGSLAKDAATAQQSLGVQIQKTREEFQRFIRDLTQSKTFQDTARFLLDMASAFIKVADVLKPLIPLISGFAAIKLGQALLPGIKSLTAAKRNMGGPIGFASGGMVPGSGNGDTVPAMLTPGEFVIRKSSVNKLGADNLARMNKYAKGGVVNLAKLSPSISKGYTNKFQPQDSVKSDVIRQQIDEKKLLNTFGYPDLKTFGNEINTLTKGESGRFFSKQGKAFEKFVAKKIFPNYKMAPTANYPVDLVPPDNSTSPPVEVRFRNEATPDAFILSKRLRYNVETNKIQNNRGFTSKADNDVNIGRTILLELEPGLKDKIFSQGEHRPGGILPKTKARRERRREDQAKLLEALNLNTGGFVKLHSAGTRQAKSKLRNFNVRYPDGQTGDLDHTINFKENSWDASFDVSDPKAFSYFVRSIHESPSQKAAMAAYAKTKGQNDKQIYNLLQGQNADWFEDRIHDEIGGTLAGGNYYVDILNAQKLLSGDVDVKDTKKREPIGEFFDKAYKHAAWEFTSGLSAKDPRTANDLSLSSVTTHTNDPVFKKSLKEKISELTSKSPSAQTVALLKQLGLERPTFSDVDKVVSSATFKERSTEYNGKKLSNLATYETAKQVYDRLAKKYRDKKLPALESTFSTILGEPIKGSTSLTPQMVGAIEHSIAEKYNKMAKGGSIASLTDIPWMSKGGAAGTDTVPAMLTPGEFVINKKSAQAIGRSGLERMNKVGKFAKGGAVGKFGQLAGTTPYSAKAASQTMPSSSAMQKVEDDFDEFDKELQRIVNKTGMLSSSFGLLIGSIAAILPQMTSMKKEYADMITAFSGTFTAINSIGQSLKTTGAAMGASLIQQKRHKQSVENDTAALNAHAGTVAKDSTSQLDPKTKKLLGGLEAGMTAAESAITGFAIAASAQSALAARDAAKAEKQSDKLDKAMERFAKSVNNESEVRAGLITTLTLSEQAQARQNAAMSTKAMGGSAVGTGIGIAVGMVLEKKFKIKGATAALGTAGGAIGGFLGGESANQYDAKKVMEASNFLADTFIEAGKGVSRINKFMERIDTKSSLDVQKELNEMTDALGKANKAYGSFDPEMLKTASEEMKRRFNDAGDAAKQFSMAVDKLASEMTNRILKQMQEFAKVGLIFDSSKIQKEVDKFAELSRKRMASQYDPAIERAQKKSKKKGDLYDLEATTLKGQKEQSANKEIAEFKKLMLESSIQILKQERALIVERDAREKIIGSLAKENALRASLERFSFAVNKAAKSSDMIDAAYSDSVQGLRNSIPDSSIFDLEFPDPQELNNALEMVKSIGPIGEELAQNLNDLNKVTPNLDSFLNALSAKKFGEIDISKDLDKAIQDMFDIDVSGPVGSALKKYILSKYTNENKEGGGGTIDREAIKKDFEGFSKELREKGKGLLSAMEDADKKQRQIADKIIQSDQRRLELANQGVDSYGKLLDSISKWQGKSVPLNIKNGMRFQKMLNMLGRDAYKTIPQLGSDLREARSKLNAGNLKPLEAARLSSKAKNLESALKQLADQSGRTSDVLGELEKAKANREQIQKNLTNYAFGSDEDRQGMDKAAQALQTAIQTGDIDAIEGPMRREVEGLLDNMGDAGKNIKKELTARFFEKSGQYDLAQAARAEATTPEMQMIGELQKIYAEEIAAQEELMKKEAEYSSSQLQEYAKISQQLATYNQQLAQMLENFKAGQGKAAEATGERVPKLTTEAIDAKIKEQEAILAKVNENIGIFNTNLDALNKKMQDIAEAKETGKSTVAAGQGEGTGGFAGQASGSGNAASVASATMAQGGLVYLASGGQFKAKGTDTVPAMLTPGEFVMKKSAVDRIGADNLSAMNKGGSVGYYAEGGIVNENAFVTMEKPKFKPEDDDLTNHAKARQYAMSRKGEIEKANEGSWFSSPDYSILEKETIEIPTDTGPRSKKVTLNDLLTKSAGEVMANRSLDKLGKGNANVFENEKKDDKEAYDLAYKGFVTEGKGVAFANGLFRGMTNIPFIGIADLLNLGSLIGELDKYTGIKTGGKEFDNFLKEQGKAPLNIAGYKTVGDLWNALRFLDAGDIISSIAPEYFASESQLLGGKAADYFKFGRDLGEVFNIGEWATGTAGAKLQAKIAYMAKSADAGVPVKILNRLLKTGAAGTAGLDYVTGAIGKVTSVPLSIAGSALSGVFKKIKDKFTSKAAKEAAEKTAKEAAKQAAEKTAKEAAEKAKALATENAAKAEAAAKQKMGSLSSDGTPATIKPKAPEPIPVPKPPTGAVDDLAESAIKNSNRIEGLGGKSGLKGLAGDFVKGLTSADTLKGFAKNGIKRLLTVGGYRGVGGGAISSAINLLTKQPEIQSAEKNEPVQLKPAVSENVSPAISPVKPAEIKKEEQKAIVTPKELTSEKKKKRRRGSGMSGANMFAYNAMQQMGSNYVQEMIRQQYALNQSADQQFFSFMNQGPQVIAGPGFRYFASGGMAKGTDTVPAMLTPGEFVMSKKAVDKHGVGMMQHLNAGGKVKYLGGGSTKPIKDSDSLDANEMSWARYRTGGTEADVNIQREEYLKKRDEERARSQLILDNIKKDKETAKATKAAGSLVGSMMPGAGFQGWGAMTGGGYGASGGPAQTVAPAATASKTANAATVAQRQRQRAMTPMAMQRAAINQGMMQRRINMNQAYQNRGVNFSKMNFDQPSISTREALSRGNNENLSPALRGEISQHIGEEEGGRGAGAGGFGDSAKVLSQASEGFSKFTETLNGIAQQFSGLTVTHKVTVDGGINVTGIDVAAIANTIKANLMNAVGKLVNDQLSKLPLPGNSNHLGSQANGKGASL